MSGNNGQHSGNGHDRGPEDEDDGDNVIRIPTLAERDKMRREQEAQWRAAYRASQPHEPMINLPPVTKWMAAAILVIHALTVFALDDIGRYELYRMFGFIPASYTVEFPDWPALIGPFSYMLLHGSWLHVGMNAVMLTAFGAGVEKWMGGRRLLILFVACALAAALIHLLLSPFSETMMIGASGGVSGLFAAVLIMLQQQGRIPLGRYGIWPFAGLWIVISILFGMTGGPDGSAIAWAAHIGGFLAGLLFIKPVLRMRG